MNNAQSNVLIVEDEQEIADTLSYALKSEGYNPIWVGDGGSARSTLETHCISIIILDVGLPDLNGFELLKSIRTSGTRYAETPCLFLTARNEEIDRIVGLEIGADDYVSKPFSPREIVARVKAILKRAGRNQPIASELNPSLFTHYPAQRTIK